MSFFISSIVFFAVGINFGKFMLFSILFVSYGIQCREIVGTRNYDRIPRLALSRRGRHFSTRSDDFSAVYRRKFSILFSFLIRFNVIIIELARKKK